MVARTLARLPKLHSTIIAQRCFLPSSGKLVTTNAHRSGSRESGQTNRYAIPQGLVVQTRDIHLTRRNESTVLLAGVGVAVGALAARQALIEFRKYQVSWWSVTRCFGWRLWRCGLFYKLCKKMCGIEVL